MTIAEHAARIALYLPTLLLLGGCATSPNADSDTPLTPGLTYGKTDVSPARTSSTQTEEWDAYWNAGQAELNSYKLHQKRYGADRTGEAVLIFVTEPFLTERQVKQDDPDAGGEATKVLKLNRIHRFRTGIYDYSLMLSVFTPVDRSAYPHTLKTTLGAQDWCGQSWWQINLRSKGYLAERRSYFEAEGDGKLVLREVLLEDELLNLVRLDPGLIPTGVQELIPGAMFSALDHKLPRVRRATVSFSEGEDERVLEVAYPELERTLSYRFAAEFPYRLLGWTETFRGEEESSAELLATRQGAYWTENKPSFSNLRDSLQL